MITLSKNSWHYKLQKYVLRANQKDYKGFCPYFWMTIWCLILCPFTALFHLIPEIKITPKTLEDKIKKFTRKELIQLYILEHGYFHLRHYVSNKIGHIYIRTQYFPEILWKSIINCQEEIEAEKQFLLAKSAKQENKVVQNQALSDKVKSITKFTRYIWWPLVGATVTILMGWFFYLLTIIIPIILISLYHAYLGLVYYGGLEVIGVIILESIFAIGVLLGSVYTMYHLSKKDFTWLKKTFSFTGLFIKSVKENNCPLIIWKEDNL